MRKSLLSYRFTSSSNAAASPLLQACTSARSRSNVYPVANFTFPVIVSSTDTSQDLFEHQPGTSAHFREYICNQSRGPFGSERDPQVLTQASDSIRAV